MRAKGMDGVQRRMVGMVWPESLTVVLNPFRPRGLQCVPCVGRVKLAGFAGTVWLTLATPYNIFSPSSRADLGGSSFASFCAEIDVRVFPVTLEHCHTYYTL